MYGLIGKPLGGSFSAQWFGRRGVDYRNFELDSIAELPELLLEHPSLRGFNVTSPYKESVLPFLDSLSPTAEAVGAVNCVSVEYNALIGHNTDALALKELLAEYNASPALILGTGGAARAAMWALGQLGIGYAVVSRKSTENRPSQIVTYDSLTHFTITSHPLIINATPVGMPGQPGLPAIPYDALGKEHLLFDMIYNPARTEFLREGQLRGARTLNGLPMLIRQAELSAQVWGL